MMKFWFNNPLSDLITPSILSGSTLDSVYGGNLDLVKLLRAGSPIDRDNEPPGAATTIQRGTNGFPALILSFGTTVKVDFFFLIM